MPPRYEIDKAREHGQLNDADWFVCRIGDAGRRALGPWIDELMERAPLQAAAMIETRGCEQFRCVDRVRELWSALATEPARQEALALVDNAADEKAARIKVDGRTVAQRRRFQYESEKRAASAAEEALQTLRALRCKLGELQNAMETVMFPSADIAEALAADRPDDFDTDGHWPRVWDLVYGGRGPELLEQLDAALEALQFPQAPTKLRRGRPPLPALNQAILQLGDLLPSTLAPDARIDMIHTALYFAGVWPNPDPETLRVREHELRQGLTNLPISSSTS